MHACMLSLIVLQQMSQVSASPHCADSRWICSVSPLLAPPSPTDADLCSDVPSHPRRVLLASSRWTARWGLLLCLCLAKCGLDQGLGRLLFYATTSPVYIYSTCVQVTVGDNSHKCKINGILCGIHAVVHCVDAHSMAVHSSLCGQLESQNLTDSKTGYGGI